MKMIVAGLAGGLMFVTVLLAVAAGGVTAAVSGGGSAAGPVAPAASEAVASEVVAYAEAQIGVPYLWGGDGPGGFDCSGLTQAAYAAAGVAIPRTSEAQWQGLVQVPVAAMQPGDLVFFNPGEFEPGLPGHVGIYIGGGQMVDAPHAGATVRIDDLAGWPAPFGAARSG